MTAIFGSREELMEAVDFYISDPIAWGTKGSCGDGLSCAKKYGYVRHKGFFWELMPMHSYLILSFFLCY